MFSQIYNWIVGRINVACNNCGREDYIYKINYNPNVIYCCSNTCSYQYYNKFFNTSSPYYNPTIIYNNSYNIDIV